MSALLNLTKNTIARSATEIVNRASSALFWIVVTRYLGASGLGAIALAISLSSIFSMIATLGLGSYVIRDVSQNRELTDKYFTSALILSGVGTIIAMAALFAFIHFMHYEESAAHACYILALSLPPMYVIFWCRAVLLAHEKMEYIAYVRFIENAVKVGGGILLVIMDRGVLPLMGAVLLSKIAAACCIVLFTRFTINLHRLNFDKLLTRNMIRQIPVFLSASALNSMFWSVPIIIMPKAVGLEAAGIYSAAYKLVDILLCFSVAFSQAIFPLLSQLSVKSRELFEMVCLKSVKLVTIFTTAIATGTTILADKIIILIYGEQMIASVLPLQILIWSIIPYGLVPLLAYALISKNLQKLDMISNFSAFVTVWSLNITLIVLFGFVGASAATLAATSIFAASQIYFVNKRLFNVGPFIRFVKPLCAALAMGLCIFLLRQINVYVLTVVGGCIYLLMIFMTKTISAGDMQFYRQLRSL